MKRLVFGLSLLLVSISAYSQNVLASNLVFYNYQTEGQFNSELSDFRFYNRSRGTLEMTDNPNYVWQDISRQLRNHYGNRPPRVGDVFLYTGAFSNNQNWYILFRITQVNGMSVSHWNASRWRSIY